MAKKKSPKKRSAKKTGRPSKTSPTGFLHSKYAGKIARAKTRFKTAATVGDLVDQLTQLPRDIPLGDDDYGIRMVWFNIGQEDLDEHISFKDGSDYLYEEDDDEHPEG